MEFNLGDKVRIRDEGIDRDEELEVGIVVGIVEYFTGTRRLGFQGTKRYYESSPDYPGQTDRCPDGRPPRIEWLDTQELELIQARAIEVEIAEEVVADYNFGDLVKDRVTELEGVVIGKVGYLTGTKRLAVLLDTKDCNGQPSHKMWLDIRQLEMVRVKAVSLGPDEEAVEWTKVKKKTIKERIVRRGFSGIKEPPSM